MTYTVVPTSTGRVAAGTAVVAAVVSLHTVPAAHGVDHWTSVSPTATATWLPFTAGFSTGPTALRMIRRPLPATSTVMVRPGP